jgi:hypothetical protein
MTLQVRRLFIEAVFHQNGISSKQLFIVPCKKWLIHQKHE